MRSLIVVCGPGIPQRIGAVSHWRWPQPEATHWDIFHDG
jgi:hypothetical protein